MTLRPGHEQRGHIVGVGEQPVVIARPARCQKIVTDPLAVDADLVDAERRDIESRAGGLPIEIELPPAGRAPVQGARGPGRRAG